MMGAMCGRGNRKMMESQRGKKCASGREKGNQTSSLLTQAENIEVKKQRNTGRLSDEY